LLCSKFIPIIEFSPSAFLSYSLLSRFHSFKITHQLDDKLAKNYIWVGGRTDTTFLPFGVCHYENVTALFDCKIIDTPLKIDIDFQNTITQNLKKNIIGFPHVWFGYIATLD